MIGLGVMEIVVLVILGLGLFGITMLVLRLSQRDPGMDDDKVAELERENRRLRRELDDKTERPE
jgi:hypothetical protein